MINSFDSSTLWFARVRRKGAGEIIPTAKVTSIFSESSGEIKLWVYINTGTNSEKIDCQLELFTGFFDKNRTRIYENDLVFLDGEEYVVGFDYARGEWAIENSKEVKKLFLVVNHLEKKQK